MKTSLHQPGHNNLHPSSGDPFPGGTQTRHPGRPLVWLALLAGCLGLWFGAPAARADQNPPGCTGSGLGISLFTASPDVHIGDTLYYGITVYNGSGNSNAPVVCDATSIQAFIVTPDGVTNRITLLHTNMVSGQFDYYPNVVSYVVRAQDIQPDQSVDATAYDTGVIHQNDNDSEGGGNQGVNTEVSLPCLLLTMQCAGGVGQNGAITFSGTVTNCGNDTLVNVTVTNFVNGGQYSVAFITNILSGQMASFNGSWIPLNPCSPSTVTLEAEGTDQYTTHPRTVTSSITNTCSETLTPGIVVTKTCPVLPATAGQLLTFSGSVSNSGNVTLTGIVVVNNQPAPNTTVFTAASLVPGAITNFTASYLAPSACSVADTLIATGTSTCGVPVTNTASATCPVTTTPVLIVTQNCPATPPVPGALLTYSGTVTNAGNVTLTNIVVVNNLSGSTPIYTAATLAPGAGAGFSGSYLTPTNCTTTSTSTATGRSVCGVAVTNSAGSTCAIATTPALTLTQNCPGSPTVPGALLTYFGTVTNAGNITLTNVVVLNNLSGSTPVFTAATLAPGAGADFSGSYLTPTNCSVTSTSTATGQSVCGVSVTNSASSTCAIRTTPVLTITQTCPAVPTAPGALLTYSGTVTNAGNITLTNVVVLNNLSGATPVYTVATLAPGAGASFTGSYLTPTNCSTTSTSTATGESVCGVGVTNSAGSTCAIITTPVLVMTQNCPASPPVPGALLTYYGTVTNAGNITLTNVVVLNNLSGSTPIYTAATLAPGVGASFTGSYLTPTNCSVTSTSTATGESVCGLAVTNSVNSTCAITTAPALTLTQNCPAVPPAPGALLTYYGTVTNAGNITLTNVVVLNNLSGSTPIYTAATLAPGAGASFTGSYLTPTNCSVTSTSTATGESVCGVSVTNSVNSTCAISTAPALTLTQNCPASPPAPGALLTYYGTVTNAGNITLTNVVVLNNLSGSTPIYTAATLAPGAGADYSGSFVTPTNCSTTSISTATGKSVCGVSVTNSLSSTCAVATAPALSLMQNCPATPPVPGALLTYSGTVTNAGNITITNVVVRNNLSGSTPIYTAATLAPGVGASFTGSYLTPTNCSTTSTSTATGESVCGVAVTNSVNSTCAISTTPVLTLTQNCPASPPVPGALLTYYGTVTNAGNITLTNVIIVNNQSGATPIFIAASLAPGAGADFSGSYLTPTNCSTTSTSTATGESVCGVAVTNSVNSTCAISTAPALTLTQNCPATPPAPGALLTYYGTVTNAGNITLTNVVVLNNLSGATPVFTAATLAPGAGADYSGSFVTPTNCSVTSISTATGKSVCGVSVTNSLSSTCAVATAPALSLMQNCPATPPVPGALLTYSGTVTNAGNITLTNVVVLNNLSGSTPIFTAATLAPGVGASFTGSYLTPTNCSTTSISTATGESVCGVGVTNSVNSTCAISTTPVLTLTQNCPASPPVPGALLTYYGTVTNAGNITITNVVVLNNLSGSTPIYTAAALAPGVGASFTGSYLTPTNCSTTSTSTATGRSVCGVAVTNAASSTCAITTTPGLVITQACPVNPVLVGGLFTYSGSVSNAGNITLTNVVVMNNQSGVLLTAVTLLPTQTTNFTGSYLAPTNCSTTTISTATGRSICGLAVTNAVTTTCAILTTPAIVVTVVCPTTPVYPGGLLTYTGSVSNSGNYPLTNVIVVSDRPAANTTVYTVTTLAPGASANFSGSYTTPPDCCVVWSDIVASGQGCSGVTVTDEDTTTCTIATTPRLVVTKICNPGLLQPGSLLAYSGSVSNAGNITLVDVTVVNSESPNNPPLADAIDLAPGQSVDFYGSYVVPPDFCGSDTVTALGYNVCTDAPVTNSVTTTCPITTTPRIIVTKNCPLLPTPRGGLYTYSGSVSNAGNVSLVNIYVVDDEPTNNTPVIGPLTLAPGVSLNFTNSYIAPACCCLIIDTLTVSGQDHCSGSNVTDTATTVCPLLTIPSLAVVPNCPANPIPMGSLYEFSGYVTNTSDVVLTNVWVFGPNTPVLGPIDLAPGQAQDYSGAYTVPFNTCSVTVTATGQETCGGTFATNTASCPVATTALLALTQNCPLAPVGPGGLLTYSGSVSNAGNVTLLGVQVLNNLSGATPIFTAAALAPGAVAGFTGSYLAPTNCFSTSLSTATGQSICGVAVTNTVSSTCPIITTPALSLTQNCPATPPAPGALLTYYGTVTNAGNITLTNVVVLNNQSGATPVFTAATLAPGAGADYSGSFVTPTNCSTTSISTAIGESVCGVAVTNSLSSTCAVATAPAITIIQTCPVTPPLPGGLLIYSGSVSNAGNITLTNLVVLNNLSGITPVLTAATLAPGAVTNYTGSYLAPTNCSSTSLSTATGRSICGVAVTNIASTTCMVATTPGLSITEICPPGPVTAGSAVVFGGVVSNTGNTILLNVLVYSSQPSNNLPVLNLVSLAPGASAPFTGGYIALGGSNPATNSTIITNSSGSITTNVVTTIAVSNTVTFTTNTVTPTFGTIDPVVGALTDRFSITNGVKGLMYADQNENWGPTLFYAIRTPGSGADEFVTIAPAGGVTDRLALTSTNYDTLTMSPPDVGYGSMNFYYLRHANNGAATFGEIIAQGASASADLWPVANTGYTGLAFAAANVGYGANLFYYVRNSVTGVAAFGTINPTPGGVETDLYTVGTNFDSLVYVPGAVSDWGTAIFAYLRHDSTGSIIGTINPVTQAVTDRLSLGTNHLSDLTFTATDVGYGPNLFYYIRPASSSVTTNLLTTFTTNTVTTLITNTVTTYVTNSLVSFTPTNTVTAIGMDVCQAGTVTAAANCLGPIAHTAVSSLQPLISVPLLVHGVFSLSLPTVTGESYILQFKNVLTDPAWTDLQTVPGTGGNLSFTNPIPAGQMTRFYRIMITP